MKSFPPESFEKDNDISNTSTVEQKEKTVNENVTPISSVPRPFAERGLTKETIGRFKVDVGGPSASYEAKYPIFNIRGEHVANKVRYPRDADGKKRFAAEGRAKELGLWGRHAFPPKSANTITITEGQDDAMAVYQMMGSKYPVVSIHSSVTAERDVRVDFEYLNSFQNIVLCMDNDEQGKKAVRAITNVGFPPGKLKVMTPRRHKDANDYLLAREGEIFSKEWWQAPVYRPDGLRIGTELWQDIIDRKDSFAVPYPFEGLNKMTFGLRLSELVTVTADSGVGKTSVLKTIERLLLLNEEAIERKYGVGLLHLEESNGDTALGLLSIHNQQPYHLPTTDRKEEDLKKAYDELLNNDRFICYDHFGSNSIDTILDKVRHMVAMGCKYVVIDHLSIIVSDQSGDERKQLDEITTKLKTLTMELDIAVIVVVHTNRQGQIRGTAGVEQLSNIVLRLQRDKMDSDPWRRNVTTLSVEKNRFSGFTGPSCYLWYNPETSTLTELDEEASKIFEEGGKLNDDQMGW